MDTQVVVYFLKNRGRLNKRLPLHAVLDIKRLKYLVKNCQVDHSRGEEERGRGGEEEKRREEGDKKIPDMLSIEGRNSNP